MIVQDITRLIVPSAKNLATCSARHLDPLIENVDEGWTEGIPMEVYGHSRITLLDSGDPQLRASSSTSSIRSSAASMIPPFSSQPTGCTSRRSEVRCCSA